MKHAVRISLLFSAVLLLGAAIAWQPFVEPLIVRFPTDVDTTIRYEGTFVVAADPATLAPLPAPMTLPLKVDRRIHVVESSFRTVVVREDITMHVGDLPASTDRISHEMDRRTMRLVDGPDSWAYDPSHVVPRRGTYRISFPLNTTTGRDYRFWANETDTVSVVDGGGKPGTVERLDVLWYRGGTDAKANSAYVAALVEKGFKAGANYEYMADDTIAVEPRTGTLIDTRSTEAVRVRNADGTAQQVFTARFAQTPASVAEVADEVRSQLRTLSLVQTWAPLTALALGGVLLVVAGVLGRGARGVVVRRPRPRPVPVRV
jgi:hypothetical protein